MNKNKDKVLLSLLIYTLLVILWGAWVRISHSGDGCGESWPLCHGEVIPDASTGKTWVEYFHRLMSGTFGILVFAIWIWSRKNLAATSLLRKYLNWTLLFTISEALLGAKLVLFGLVTDNDSPYRALIMALHLLNSLLLMASITLAWQNSQNPSEKNLTSTVDAPKWIYFSFVLLCMTGAVAALATTLFPTESLLDGIRQDLQKDAHFLIRLRGLHPLLALTFGSLLAFWSYKKGHLFLSASFVATLLVGILTLILLSPLFLKIAHLTMIHFVWIQLIILWNLSNIQKYHGTK
jgi:cytochrome c oxidase assembly protein subunit 15